MRGTIDSGRSSALIVDPPLVSKGPNRSEASTPRVVLVDDASDDGVMALCRARDLAYDQPSEKTTHAMPCVFSIFFYCCAAMSCDHDTPKTESVQMHYELTMSSLSSVKLFFLVPDVRARLRTIGPFLC